jgi:hypothetical protein
MPDQRSTRLRFSWKTSGSEECRGNRPAHDVALQVGKRLCVRYSAWILDYEPKTDEWSEDATDLFGPGLAFWIEKTFQRFLVRVKPDAIWYAQNRPTGRRTEEGWEGIGSVHGCDHGRGPNYPSPCVIHTVWPNGSVYAQLRNFYTFESVEEFALESLDLAIRKITKA